MIKLAEAEIGPDDRPVDPHKINKTKVRIAFLVFKYTLLCCTNRKYCIENNFARSFTIRSMTSFLVKSNGNLHLKESPRRKKVLPKQPSQ